MMVSLPEPKEPLVDFCFKAKLLRIVDGDTLVLDIDRGWDEHKIEKVRLARCDTPESNRYPEMPAGKWVTEHVSLWIGDSVDVKIQSMSYNPDKYKRSICEVWIEGYNISSWLLRKQYAWPTDDDGDLLCPRDINLLAGIPDDIRKLAT